MKKDPDHNSTDSTEIEGYTVCLFGDALSFIR
jgi:hypothetical protein